MMDTLRIIVSLVATLGCFAVMYLAVRLDSVSYGEAAAVMVLVVAMWFLTGAIWGAERGY